MSDPLSGFNNKDVIIVIDDTPGDTTVRPSPPEMRKRLEAEREKIRLWEEFLKQQEEKKKQEITDQGCEGKETGKSRSSPSGLNSQDCFDIILDGPGDTTVRPARPLLRKHLEAEREKLRQWEEFLKQQQEQPKPEEHGPEKQPE